MIMFFSDTIVAISLFKRYSDTYSRWQLSLLEVVSTSLLTLLMN